MKKKVLVTGGKGLVGSTLEADVKIGREYDLTNTNETRIDRSNMTYDLNLIGNGHYIDFHSPRPYEDHKDEIEKIISCVN